MTTTKDPAPLLPWVDLLSQVTPEMSTLRGEVTELMAEAMALDLQANELRAKAYFKTLDVEAMAKAANGPAAVDHVKQMASQIN